MRSLGGEERGSRDVMIEKEERRCVVVAKKTAGWKWGGNAGKGRDGEEEIKNKTERRKSSEGEHGLIRYSIHTNSHPFTISNRGAHPTPLPCRQRKLSQTGPARYSPSCQQLAFGHARNQPVRRRPVVLEVGILVFFFRVDFSGVESRKDEDAERG